MSVAGTASLHTRNGELTQLDLWFKQEARPDDSLTPSGFDRLYSNKT